MVQKNKKIEIEKLKRKICNILNAKHVYTSPENAENPVIIFSKNTKQRSKKQRSMKNKSRRKPISGGKIGANEVSFYIFGYPNQANKESAMSYMEVKNKNPNDLFQIENVENFFRSIISQEPPRVWTKTIKVK